MKISGIKKIGKEKLLLLVAAGIILIIVSYFDIGSKKDTANTEVKEVSSQKDYANEMEQKIEKLINSIDGISNVQAVITLKEGSEKVVKEDIDSSNSEREEESAHNVESSVKKTTVILSDNGKDTPYIIKEIYPQIRGIAITAKGVSDISKRDRIINMLSALFDVPVHKISVIEI